MKQGSPKTDPLTYGLYFLFKLPVLPNKEK